MKTGSALPQATVDAVRLVDGAMFGAVSSPSSPVTAHGQKYSSPIVALRKVSLATAAQRRIELMEARSGCVGFGLVRQCATGQEC
jgi:isocitrate/isopropylmalate dehydrogenase